MIIIPSKNWVSPLKIFALSCDIIDKPHKYTDFFTKCQLFFKL